MIASLPMYDRPETRAANDRFWTAIRAALGFGPKALTRDEDVWSQWTAPDLLLSQTCGLPYAKSLAEKVQLVATPIHNLPCPPGQYFSVLVARASDTRDDFSAFADARVAVNDYGSQSGWGALWKMSQDQGVTLKTSVTGEHRASARAVATGDADLAAIDPVTWQMIERWDRFARHLCVVAETPPTAALPYITSLDQDAAVLRDALSAAIQSLSPEDRDTLCLTGITFVPPEHYFALPKPPEACLSSQNP